jgi:glutaredoxin
MQYLTFFLVILSVMTHMSGVADGEIYKWIDNKGIAHFGDAPLRNARSTSKIESMPTTLLKAPDPQVTLRKEEKPQAMNRSMKKAPPQETLAPVVTDASVEMFATSWCGYCKKAREFFEARGIVLTEYDIEADAAAAQRKQEIYPSPGVPLVVINGKPIQGFAPHAYEQALRAQ